MVDRRSSKEVESAGAAGRGRYFLFAVGCGIVFAVSAAVAMRLSERDSPALRVGAAAADASAFVEKNTDYATYEGSVQRYLADVSTRVTAPPVEVGDVQEPVDPDWEKYPRTGRLVPLLMTAGDAVDVSQLFRNRDLNPADTCIAKKHRGGIEQIVASANADLVRLSEVGKGVAADEFKTLVAGGRARSLSVDDYRNSLAPEELAELDRTAVELQAQQRQAMEGMGLSKDEIERQLVENAPVVFKPNQLFGPNVYAARVEGGKILGATTDELPRTLEAINLRRHRLMELGAETTAYFVAQKCLDRKQADSILKELSSELFTENERR